MKDFRLFVLILAIPMFLTVSGVKGDVDIGLSLDDDGIRSFYLSVGDHYGVKEKEVMVIKKKNIPDEELPVVFFLARHARVEPSAIIKLRLSDKSWIDICFHYGLSAEIFHVPLGKKPGPPYGKAYGHFKKHKKSEWNTIRLTDVDIVNFVNLKFISAHYGYSPDEIIKMRGKGKSFVKINGTAKETKLKKKQKSQRLSSADQTEPKKTGKKKKK